MAKKNRIAKFEKVSYEQFLLDLNECMGFQMEKNFPVEEWYDGIQLPTRSTAESAGYDFFLPLPFSFVNDKWYTLPTGIRCNIQSGWVLMLCPKSGLGCKYGMRLANTVGVIDSDYYYSVSNEGHIMAKIKFKEPKFMEAGTKFMQGLFLPFGITDDDDADGVRDGGFGSTGK